jgi:hypothetical protein
MDVHLRGVAERVAVRVGRAWVRPMEVHLRGVTEPIAIGVARERVRPVPVDFVVRESVAVAVRDMRVGSECGLAAVEQAVRVAVELAAQVALARLREMAAPRTVRRLRRRGDAGCVDRERRVKHARAPAVEPDREPGEVVRERDDRPELR